MILCFDMHRTIYDRFQNRFLSPLMTAKLVDSYSLGVVVSDEIIKLFDKTVWSLRDVVRLN